MKLYLQTTNFTTAASALLTILHHFNPKIKLSKENEFEIWKKTVNLPTRGSSIFALANYAQLSGLNPKVIVETKKYNFPDYRFYRYKKEDVEQAKFSDLQHLKEAGKNNVLIEKKEIDFKDIKNELKKNNLLLLRLNTKPIRNEKRNTSNFIIVSGYENNYYHIFDPAMGGISIPKEIMKEAFFTLETKKYRDHGLIVFKEKPTE
ncbi:hypothetical protein HON71_01655 [Candidatus Woesearchaeota archaeon]|jgi:predicted double-glycine peptidase|nr:hypothetical protein [Candidatus Woesearchaeota archaeon]MBT5342505.1 hypothetical protein [Candidatus Woesearchaeota archaeon]